MFNLIVSGKGWNDLRDSFPCNRVLQFTDDELKQRFKPNGQLDFEAVSKLPTLFMTETWSVGTPSAHVGMITAIRSTGTDYQLEYTYDTAIRPISNNKIAELANELQIHDWEFTRTHWAIKDVDLFRVLMRNNTTELSPRVFQLSDEPVDGSLVAVMMPFSANFDGVYTALDEAVRKIGKYCQRADDIWRHDAVIQDIVSLIGISSVVICDLSSKNANVFYEAGIAHAIGKDVILITQSEDDVPFNLRHLRFVKYLNNGEGRERLAEVVVNRIKTLDSMPISR